MTLTVMLDVLVAGLLVATIIYAILLSRRLGALRNDKQQLEALVRSLDESARRAETGVASLKQAADQIGQELQQRIDRGQGLRTDLTYMVDLAGNLADRLESVIRSSRDDARQPTPSGAEPEARPRRGGSSQGPVEPTFNSDRRDGPVTNIGKGEPRVAGFPSRAERLLRRALEARN